MLIISFLCNELHCTAHSTAQITHTQCITLNVLHTHIFSIFVSQRNMYMPRRAHPCPDHYFVFILSSSGNIGSHIPSWHLECENCRLCNGKRLKVGQPCDQYKRCQAAIHVQFLYERAALSFTNKKVQNKKKRTYESGITFVISLPL